MNKSNNLILWFFLALFLISILLLGWMLLPFLSILIMASVVTWMFHPIYRRLVIKDMITGPFAAMLTCTLIFFIIFVPLIFFGSVLSKEAYNLYLMGKSAVVSGNLKSLLESSDTLEKINQILANFNFSLTIEELNNTIMDLGKDLGKFLFDQATRITGNVLSFIVDFFFMLLVTFFLLMDGRKLINFISALSPLPMEQDERLIQKFKDISAAVLIGNGLCGLIQGVAGGVVFFLFDLSSPFLWGVVMAFLAFLPIVGIGAVFIPAALYLFLTGQVLSGIFFIIFYVLLSGGIEYLLKPKIVGNRVQMHTLVVFLAIIGGLKLFGILGIIYGPLVVTAFLTMADIYRANYQNLIEPGGYP